MTADLLMLYGFYSFQKFKISEFYSFLMPVEEKVLPNCIVSGVVALSGIPSWWRHFVGVTGQSLSCSQLTPSSWSHEACLSKRKGKQKRFIFVYNTFCWWNKSYIFLMFSFISFTENTRFPFNFFLVFFKKKIETVHLPVGQVIWFVNIFSSAMSERFHVNARLSWSRSWVVLVAPWPIADKLKKFTKYVCWQF